MVTKMDKKLFHKVDQELLTTKEQIRPSLSFWQDAWRRFKKNKLAVAGMIGVLIVTIFGLLGPYMTPYSYSYQQTDYSNVPPQLTVYRLDEEHYV